MELMQLEMFVAVVEEGSVRRASERVYRTQPAVSIAVRKLEREFEAPLFDRSKRYSFRLTQAGESLYRHAKRILNLRSEAVAQLENIAKLRTGCVSIGANESISLHVLPRLTHEFLKKHPGVRLDLRCERSEDLLRDLKDRRLDVAILSFRPDDPDLECSFLAEDELVLITGPKHSLAEKMRVRFEDLREEPVLMMDVSSSSPWHKRVDDAFRRFKITLHLQVENAPIEAIKKMVALGTGVGFIPLLSVHQEVARGELRIVRIEGFREVRSVWLVRRWALEAHGANAFIDVASAFAAEVRANSRGIPNDSRANKVVSVSRRA
jgi:DNA-binding transcriptional LysR family regulator